MTSFDTVLRFLEEAYIGKNYSYAKDHLSEDYICHCFAGTKNKSEALSLLKTYHKKYSVHKIYISDSESSEETVSLSILFQCSKKEKFLGITIGENTVYLSHHKTFKVKNGVITESWDTSDDEI